MTSMMDSATTLSSTGATRVVARGSMNSSGASVSRVRLGERRSIFGRTRKRQLSVVRSSDGSTTGLPRPAWLVLTHQG
jgi:hypothetical protein